MSWPNSGHKETSNNDQNKERLLAADGERELLDQLEEILGKTEMKKNGGMWRKRIRGGKVYVKALRNGTRRLESSGSLIKNARYETRLLG